MATTDIKKSLGANDRSPAITLYHFPRTHTTRVRWWLEEAKVPYESKLIDIRRGEQDKEEFRKINPLGRIPVLLEGELVLQDSLGICLYLGIRFPDSGLCPTGNTRELAEYYQWLVLANTELDRIVGRVYATQRVRLIRDPRRVEAVGRDAFLKLMDVYNARLDKSPFLVRDKLSGADIFTASILAFADSVGLMPGFGPTRTWLDRMTRLPSYARALAA